MTLDQKESNYGKSHELEVDSQIQHHYYDGEPETLGEVVEQSMNEMELISDMTTWGESTRLAFKRQSQ